MTPEQKEDLLIEWSIYNNRQQLEIINEYNKLYGHKQSEEHWLEFLKTKLEITQYWEKTGLGS
jgi:hypothetical protein